MTDIYYLDDEKITFIQKIFEGEYIVPQSIGRITIIYKKNFPFDIDDIKNEKKYFFDIYCSKGFYSSRIYNNKNECEDDRLRLIKMVQQAHM